MSILVSIILSPRLTITPSNSTVGILVPARQAISIKKVKFTGGLYYDNGTLHMSSNPEEPTYVGPPSEEIDDAWEALIHS
jgi:hypothetical protein